MSCLECDLIYPSNRSAQHWCGTDSLVLKAPPHLSGNPTMTSRTRLAHLPRRRRRGFPHRGPIRRAGGRRQKSRRPGGRSRIVHQTHPHHPHRRIRRKSLPQSRNQPRRDRLGRNRSVGNHRRHRGLVKSLWELLDGENPTRIEHLWQKVYSLASRHPRRAVHDAHPRRHRHGPLGHRRQTVAHPVSIAFSADQRATKSCCYPSPKATKVGAGPMPFSGTPAQLDRFVQMVANARERVGPDGMVMFDAHCGFPPPFLIQLASLLKPYDFVYMKNPPCREISKSSNG